MKEKRQYKRFTATLPARLEVITSSRKKVYDLEAKNISASGVFIYTKESSFFPKDARFTLDLTIPSDSIKELAEVKSLIECEGSVVRSTSEGVAIQFDRECEIIERRQFSYNQDIPERRSNKDRRSGLDRRSKPRTSK